ncbi:MAG: hypothetical protein J6J09_06570 [Phocaeicola sp.]|nr:hypothetical protein [Phocaeicola sp.]
MENRTMKLSYIKPFTETVQVRLNGSVLDSIEIGQGSPETNEGLAKENNLEFEEDDTFTTPTQPNLWDDEEQ